MTNNSPLGVQPLESYLHIASVLFYLKAWTKVNRRLACTQMKWSWILPSFTNKVEYARVLISTLNLRKN